MTERLDDSRRACYSQGGGASPCSTVPDDAACLVGSAAATTAYEGLDMIDGRSARSIH